jgi:REP element-mobilizing transposase RayT
MPSRNVLKDNVGQSFYHIYARGASKQKIFIDAADYKYFIGLFGRYLSEQPAKDGNGVSYPHFFGQADLVAYCMMRNHFHMLLYQKDENAMQNLMRSIMTSYCRYFNLRHNRTGSLFESRYKAVRIDDGTYLEHISRYIHLNPRFWRNYRYSSLSYFIYGNAPEWLQPKHILIMFSDGDEYLEFVKDYADRQLELDELKHQLADC